MNDDVIQKVDRRRKEFRTKKAEPQPIDAAPEAEVQPEQARKESK